MEGKPPGERISIIKPTIGRIVWYRKGGDSLLKEAAIIVRVWDASTVNLAVFGADGVQRPEKGVFMAQDDAPCPGEHYAEWMPYQKGQAAKTEALEAATAQNASTTLEKTMAATTHIPHDLKQSTIEVPALAPHQQRVVDEKRDLDEKIDKLAAFVQPTNAIFNGLPVAEAGRLIHQLAVMNEYSDVLGKRIEAFE